METNLEHEDGERKFVAPHGGYGRIWQSMYLSSLVGAGVEVFAVWPYVIANMRRQNQVGVAVDLNPKFLAAVFGCEEGQVELAIRKLCEPDGLSKNGHAEEGRRLVHVSGVMYRVVNGPGYMAVRSREQNAERQRRFRDKEKVKKGGKSQGAVRAENEGRERRFVEAEKAGDVGKADEIAAEGTEPADLDMPLG